MHRFCRHACLGLATVGVALFVGACSKETSRKDMGAPPPGAIGQNDPRWRGIPEETGDEKGIMTKKVFVKPNKAPAAPSK